MLSYTVYNHNTSSEWITFVHGAGGSSAIWYKQLKDFSKHYNVLLIDLRGHGRSKRSIYSKVKRYNFEVIGNEVMDVLEHISIEKTHFVGISLGTIIIRDLSERFPERCKSLILGGAVMKLNVRGQFLMKMGALFKSVIPYLLLYRLFAFAIMPKRKHRNSRNLFINEAKKLYQKEFKRWFTLVSEINPLLRLFRIRPSAIPTVYIMGSEDHMFLPSIKKLVAEHKSSKLVIIENCGHVVNVDAPGIFNEEAINFINHNK